MKPPKVLKVVTASVLVIALTGCAAMFHGTTQQAYIRSNMDDAKLYVNEGYIGTGSGVATFYKNKNYTITARKEGCQDMSVMATKSFDAVTLLGILIDWGIVSILIVDGLATGAWQQFNQTSYVLDPNCSGGAWPAAPQSVSEKAPQADAQSSQPATNFGHR